MVDPRPVGTPQRRRPRALPQPGRRQAAPAAVRAVTAVTLLMAVWLALSSLVLRYPFTVTGMDAQLWTTGSGLVLGVLAAARVRAPLSTRRSAVALLLGSALVLALPFVFGYTSGGPLAVPFWNFVLSGAALTLLSLVGVVQAFRHASRRNEARTPSKDTGGAR